jgi:hypothetical protein
MTEHFSFNELTDSRQFKEVVETNRKEAMADPLIMKRLKYLGYAGEELRAFLGRLLCTSGFRGEELNRLVGGSSTSSHKLGNTGDFVTLDTTPEKAWELILGNKESLKGIRKIIYENVSGKQWFHVEAKLLASEELMLYTTIDGINYFKV